MSELITGDELLKKYKITPPELFIYIQRGELSPLDYMGIRVCRPDRKPPRYVRQLQDRKSSLELKKSELQCKDDLLLELHSDEPFPALKIKQIEAEIHAIESELKSIKDGHPSPHDWKNFRLPENKPDAISFLRYLCACFYLDDEVAKINDGKGLMGSRNQEPNIIDNSNRKDLLPSQRHKISVIKVARALWEEDPTITIADMAHLDAINRVCDGKVYSENTIRKWIKEYCPNRAPGRRSKSVK